MPSGRADSNLTSPAVPNSGTARTLFLAGSNCSPRPVRQAGVRPSPPRSFHVEGASDLRDPHETRVAIMEDGQLCEIYIEREKEFALVGSLYKGRVTRVLPGMQLAFVDIGLDSDAFLYVSDFLEHLEDYDHVEAKVHRPAPASNEVFPPSTTNGGVIPAPVSVSEPSAAPVESVEPSGHVEHAEHAEHAGPAARVDHAEIAPIITPLEGESFQVAAAGNIAAPEGGARPAPPMQRGPRPPFEQRNDRDPGRGGFGNRGGHGGGRNRRFGRPGQGGRGGRDRRPGRDLPPSKYASPADSRPRESQPYEAPGGDFEPVILPGRVSLHFQRPCSVRFRGASGRTVILRRGNFRTTACVAHLHG